MEGRIDRRTFVGAAAAGVGAATFLGDPLAAAEAARRRTRYARTPLAKGVEFHQSVASGQVRERGATLWTRLEGLSRTSRLQVELSPDRDFRRIVHRADVVADAARDYTVRVGVDSRALRPGEQYFYRFYTCLDETSPVGRFRTARPADSREPIRIGFFSCQKWHHGFYTAHAGLAAEDLDFVVSLGDYIYEEGGSNAVPGREDRTGPNRDGEVQTLAEYRDKYRLHHSDQNLLAVRQNHPLMAIWDDHEFENNYAGDAPSENPEEQNVTMPRRVPFLHRRANAYTAFFEHMPRIRPRRARNRTYGTVRLGGLAEVFLLDTRQYRDPQACGDRSASVCPRGGDSDDPARTHLGARQKAWFKNALAASQAAWKVVANQVMIMSLEVPRGNFVNPDQWDGYVAERREILEFVRDRGVRDLTFLTGDIHTFFSGTVTPSGREGVPAVDGEPVATEFVGGSITSRGLGDDLGLQGGLGSVPTSAGIRANNLHIKYSNQTFKGYGVLEARPEELLVQYRAPRSVEQPQSEIVTIARHRVPRGVPRVEVSPVEEFDDP